MSVRMLVTECYDGNHAACKGYHGPATNPNYRCDCDCHNKQPQMDWQQVVLNGGPPCFFVEGDKFCGRAERWAGHDSIHKFVSLDGLLSTVREETQQAAFKEAADYIGHQWLSAYPVEVFPEPPPPPAPATRDAISAAMGRHMATKLIEHFEAAAKGKLNDD